MFKQYTVHFKKERQEQLLDIKANRLKLRRQLESHEHIREQRLQLVTRRSIDNQSMKLFFQAKMSNICWFHLPKYDD